PRLVDVESHGIETLAELDRQRQAYVAKPDDRDVRRTQPQAVLHVCSRIRPPGAHYAAIDYASHGKRHFRPGIGHKKARRSGPLCLGAGNRNRTYDLRITNAPLYQLSYSGEEAEL